VTHSRCHAPGNPRVVTYEVAVRTLCEFTAKRGNLDTRFTPSPTAMQRMAGHRMIAARRGSSFQTELTLTGEYGPLRIRGRADGYDPEQNRLEEFKTYRGELARLPQNHRELHWAQLRIYGWLLCKQKSLGSVQLALVYFDVASERETETAHRRLRAEALRDLHFPFADFHAGQRELSLAVYERIRTGGVLLAQAPTGIGKTVGTLFPALKAMGIDSGAPSAPALDKIFYLAAKTSGRQLALDALRRLQPLPVRIVELVARAKLCEHPDYLDVSSPFRADQLAVRVVRSISTRFRDRERSLVPIAHLLARQYAARAGNYLVFLSSFDYLDRVAALVIERYPDIPTWKQHPGMSEPQRAAFLARFVPDGEGLGFAVLGGAFAEGIDLPGSRLIGAFVATLGLPPVYPFQGATTAAAMVEHRPPSRSCPSGRQRPFRSAAGCPPTAAASLSRGTGVTFGTFNPNRPARGRWPPALAVC
jgi:Helicase C-terminal domain